MSDQIPKFLVDERVRFMNTDDAQRAGLAGLCGKLIRIDQPGKWGASQCYVVLDTKPDSFVITTNCELVHE